MSRDSLDTSPDDSAVTVMSFNFDRLSRRCVVVYGM